MLSWCLLGSLENPPSVQNILSLTMILQFLCTKCSSKWTIWKAEWVSWDLLTGAIKSLSIKSCQIYSPILWLGEGIGRGGIAQCDGSIPASNLLTHCHVSSDKKNHHSGVSGDGVNDWEQSSHFFTMGSCFVPFSWLGKLRLWLLGKVCFWRK